MANLILGPLLRRTTADGEAVIWVQTDQPTTATVLAGQITASAPTITCNGIHVTLIVVTGLPAGPTPYEVRLDGAPAWQSVINIPRPGTPLRITFGSCRRAFRHDRGKARRVSTPPANPGSRPPVGQHRAGPADGRERSEATDGQDALEAFARQARRTGELPDLLALIGDQIYADDPSPATLDWLAARDRPAHAPPGQVVSFAEYAHLYQEAWSIPDVRWLLSTVPTLMMFDDHEIIDDWNSSAQWLADISTQPWWPERISAGLVTYWLFQHAGNLSPAELARDPVWQALQDGREPVLTAYPWNVTVDLDRTRLLMLDCRGNRVLDEPRRMMPQEQWDRLARESQVDCDHLVIMCSLPWLLPPAIHHGQAVMEVLSPRMPSMERLRRKYDLEHWAAVGHSFAELTEIIDAVDGPATVTVLGGDVHHSYVAEAKLPHTKATVRQIVCSPLNHGVSGVMRFLLRIGWWRVLSGPAALVARLLGVPRPAVRWRLLTKPLFRNAIATLTLDGRNATYRIDSMSSGENTITSG